MSKAKNPLVFIEKPLFLMKVGEVGYISPIAVVIIYERQQNDEDLKYYYVINLYTSYVSKSYDTATLKITKVGEDDYDVDLSDPHCGFYPEEEVPKEWDRVTAKKLVDIVYVNTKEHYSHFTFYELLEVYNKYYGEGDVKSLEFLWASEFLQSYKKACESMMECSMEQLWVAYKSSSEKIEKMKKLLPAQKSEISEKINANHNKSAYDTILLKLTNKEEIDESFLEFFREEAEQDEKYEILSLLSRNYPKVNKSELPHNIKTLV